jgi:hypothetical protein
LACSNAEIAWLRAMKRRSVSARKGLGSMRNRIWPFLTLAPSAKLTRSIWPATRGRIWTAVGDDAPPGTLADGPQPAISEDVTSAKAAHWSNGMRKFIVLTPENQCLDRDAVLANTAYELPLGNMRKC